MDHAILRWPDITVHTFYFQHAFAAGHCFFLGLLGSFVVGLGHAGNSLSLPKVKRRLLLGPCSHV